jgi:hypothetical protein
VIITTLLSITFLPNRSYAACTEHDLPCFRRGFLERGQQIDSLGRELGLARQLLSSKEVENETLKNTNDVLKHSLSRMEPALKAGQRQWHESPQLWFAVGAGVGVLLAVAGMTLGAWALSQVQR